MNMQQTKPVGGRVPIVNKTVIPNATHERIGYQISGASHHFHRPSKIRNLGKIFFSKKWCFFDFFFFFSKKY